MRPKVRTSSSRMSCSSSTMRALGALASLMPATLTGVAGLVDSHQASGRNSEIPMQFPDHGQRQRALAVEDLIDAIALADRRLEILRRQAGLFHSELDGFDRVGETNGEMLAFVSFDQGQHDFETVAIRRSGHRLVIEIGGQRAQCGTIVGFSADWLYIHGHSISTVSASIAS